MLNNIKKRNEGFTIIEVLIVLAIAGLILLVVFLAVPALQRNSRNTQRKTDVSNTLAAVSEYVGNNSGNVPTAVSGGSATGVNIGASSGVNTVPVKLGFYDASGTPSKVTLATGATTNATTTESLVIVTGAKCSGSNAVAGSSRQYVILYTAEDNAKLCQES
ncbi:MAG TPA: type II secretion system protein [Candidatus Saccharimonadales bacterium]|nr:type II secretion system protein [Candidatus Saccharimonadales bacterium]